MYNHNKAQQSKNRVHISWDILYQGIDDKPIVLYGVQLLTHLTKLLLQIGLE